MTPAGLVAGGAVISLVVLAVAMFAMSAGATYRRRQVSRRGGALVPAIGRRQRYRMGGR